MPDEKRLNRIVTLGEALAAAVPAAPETDPNLIELNRKQTATCPVCGQEPKLIEVKSEAGKTVRIWMPLTHVCAPRKDARDL